MNKEILKRYFEGKGSRWEKKQVEEYFQGEDMHVFDEYIQEQGGQDEKQELNNKDYHPNFNTSLHSLNPKSFYQELLGKIEKKESPKTVHHLFKPYFKIAASILLISGLGATFYILKERGEMAAALPAYETLTNTGTNLKMAQLADGTKVWMNPGAAISYDKKHFGDTAREVKITGEAFFDVAHNAKKPFRVHAGKITTTVLGTAFNIEAYKNENQVRVLLVRGYVRVNAGHEQRALLPGQLLAYTNENKHMEISPVDISDKQNIYTSGKLVFENVALTDVLKRLQEVFEIKIVVINQKLLAHKTVSGNYFRNDKEETLRRILFMHGLHFNRKGEREYVITD